MKHILIVDDAATVRMYQRSILEASGYVVDEAINGIEALEKAFITPYSLYLVDVNMPKMDGYAFVRALRSHADLAQAPVVMVSTEADAADRAKAYEAGANFYIVKPIRPAVLLEYIRLFLGEPSA